MHRSHFLVLCTVRSLSLLALLGLSMSAAAADVRPGRDDGVAAYCYGLWQAQKVDSGRCDSWPNLSPEACELGALALQTRMNIMAGYLQAKGLSVDRFPNQMKQAGADRYLTRVDPSAQDRMRQCEPFLIKLQ